ncbi:MAG TPA: hypothetical protein VGN20_05750 [Mucilaginibacter sp.]|jgi:hypothetical protein
MKNKLLIVTYNTTSNVKISTWLQVQVDSRKILETTWLVSTTDTAADFFNKIEPYLDKDNDRIFISEIKPDERQGWLSRTIWDWVREKS